MAKKKKETKKKKIIKKPSKTKVTVDKWKRKTHFKIFADNNFDNKEIGDTMATKPEHIIGRKIKINLSDLTGQRQKRHQKVIFQITSTEGNNAKTEAKGFETTQGYLARIVRKRNTKITNILIEKSKDKKTIKTTTTAITSVKVPKATAKEIRKIIEKEVKEAVKKKNFALFLQDVLFGAFVSKLFKKIKKIAPIKRVEVEKTIVIKE